MLEKETPVRLKVVVIRPAMEQETSKLGEGCDRAGRRRTSKRGGVVCQFMFLPFFNPTNPDHLIK